MNTPKIRFKGFTDDWEQRKLGEVSKRVIVGLATSVTPYYRAEGVPILRNLNIKENYLDDSDILFLDRSYAESQISKQIRAGDVLTVHTGYIGTSCVVPEKYDKCLTFTTLITTTDNSVLKGEFLAQYLNSDIGMSALQSVTTQGGRQNLNTNDFVKVEIQFPSLLEQSNICAMLRNIDNLITLHQRKCDETKQLKKFMLQKMFPKNGEKNPEIRFEGFTDDWEQRKLGEMVIDHNAGIYISKEDYGEGTNVIGVGNIYDRDIFDGEIYRLGPVNDDKFILEENDIIYGESSLVPEGIARTVCVGKNGAGSAFAWHTRRVKLDKNIVNSHVATLELNYLHEIRKYLVSVSTQTALTGMTTEGYFGATLTLPSVEEQQVISDYFKNIDHLITLHQRKCEKLKELKKYMLQNMFV